MIIRRAEGRDINGINRLLRQVLEVQGPFYKKVLANRIPDKSKFEQTGQIFVGKKVENKIIKALDF